MSELVPIAEAARELNVSTMTVRRWWKRGLIELVQLPGGTLYVRRETLDQLMRPSQYRPRSPSDGGALGVESNRLMDEEGSSGSQG